MFSCIFQSLPYTRWDTVFYADYEMGGNTALTVLWTARSVSTIRVGDAIVCASTDTLRTTRIPTQKPQMTSAAFDSLSHVSETMSISKHPPAATQKCLSR